MSGKAAFDAQEADKITNREKVIQETIDPLVFKLRDAGFNILPGIVDKKHPIGGWKEYQKEFVSDDEFSKMCLNDNTGLWCIITGAVSNNLVVIDVDSEQVYNSFFKEKFEGKTTIVETPSGGRHLWFKMTGRIPKNATKYNNLPIDIRGQKGVIVCPPSISNSGEYHFVDDCKPMEIGSLKIPLGDIPKKPTTTFAKHLDNFKSDISAAGWDIHKIMTELGVNDFEPCSHAGFKCACLDHPDGPGEKSFEIYTDTNSYCCHRCKDKDYGTGDIIDVVKLIKRCGFKDAISYLEVLCGVKSKIPIHSDWSEDFDPTYTFNRLEWLDTATIDERMLVIDDNRIVNDKGVFNHDNFTQWLLFKSGEHFITLQDMDKNYGILRYLNGVYEPNGYQAIEMIAGRLVSGIAHVKNHDRNECLGQIRTHKYIDHDGVDNNETIINLENGLYNMDTEELLPHTPEYPSMFKHPVTFDPDAQCPMITKFISEIVGEKCTQTIFEVMGYTYQNRKKFKTGFFLHGEGNSGKSQIMCLIENMLHGKAKTHITPGMICDSVFGAAEIEDKLAILVDDLGNVELTNTGELKTIMGTGNSQIPVQKKYGQPHDITPKAVLICCTNELPNTNDENIKARICIIDCPNLFVEGENANPNIIEEICTEEELSGFFNCAMAAIQRVEDRGTFTESASYSERKTIYERLRNPTLQFFDERCVFGTVTAEIEQRVFYPVYQRYMWANKKKPLSKGKLTKLLEEEYGVVIYRPKRDGEQVPTYKGIMFRPDVDGDDLEMEDW